MESGQGGIKVIEIQGWGELEKSNRQKRGMGGEAGDWRGWGVLITKLTNLAQ